MERNPAECNERHKRTAIVTGGTRGMGLAITRLLAQKGMSVLAVYRSRQAEAEAAASRFLEEKLDVTCLLYTSDAADE